MVTKVEKTDLPAEAAGWNWGAFLLTWIWGLGNRTPIALLALIPLVNFPMMIILGIKGSAWAWQNDTWQGATHFRRTQRNWAIAGTIVWAGFILLAVGGFWGLMSLMKGNAAYEMSMDRLRASPEIAQVFGEPLDDGFLPSGSIKINGGSGSAKLEISISGPLAEGAAQSEAVREFGQWRLTYLAAKAEGRDDIIVVVPRE